MRWERTGWIFIDVISNICALGFITFGGRGMKSVPFIRYTYLIKRTPQNSLTLCITNKYFVIQSRWRVAETNSASAFILRAIMYSNNSILILFLSHPILLVSVIQLPHTFKCTCSTHFKQHRNCYCSQYVNLYWIWMLLNVKHNHNRKFPASKNPLSPLKQCMYFTISHCFNQAWQQVIHSPWDGNKFDCRVI